MPPRLSPPEGEAVAKSKIICSLLLSFGGTLKRGGSFSEVFFCAATGGGSVAFFFSRIVLAPAGGKFGGSLRQIKGSPRFAPLSLGRPLINPSSLLRRAAPFPRRHPPPNWGAVIACFCLVDCSLRFNLVKSRCTSSLDKFLRSGFAAFRQKSISIHNILCYNKSVVLHIVMEVLK